MANYRWAELLDSETISGATTKTVDLDVSDILSRIDIRLHRTKTHVGMAAHGAADITRLEIVDGSDVIVSLDGYECQALNIYNRPHTACEYEQVLISNSQVDMFGIDFGRYLWDRQLAFDPKQFTNPQLKITYDVDVSDTGVTSATMEIYGSFFEDRKITPLGMLAPVEHYDNAMGADGTWSDVELPTDMKIRRMLYRLFYSGYEPWYVADEVRMQEDSRKRDVFYWNTEVLYRMMHGVYPPLVTKLIVDLTTSATAFYVPQSDYWISCPFISQSGNHCSYINGGDAARGGVIDLIGEATTQFSGIVSGYLPHSCIDFALCDLNDIDDFYDPAGKGKVEARALSHSAGTSGTFSVVLEKLRRY